MQFCKRFTQHFVAVRSKGAKQQWACTFKRRHIEQRMTSIATLHTRSKMGCELNFRSILEAFGRQKENERTVSSRYVQRALHL